jgi:hypothetical protein
VLARSLESAGIATVVISLVREHTETVKPPRALWVPFPFGHAFGKPNDPQIQNRVLSTALGLLTEPIGPVLRDFPDDVSTDHQPSAPVQASAVAPNANIPDDPAMEATQMRLYHEQWRGRNGGRTAFGLTGIPATRFRGVVRFLQQFADGVDVDMPERTPVVDLPNFIRLCADDLKAMYYEARLAMKPEMQGEDVARWFWGETAAGQLLRRVRDRLDASENPSWKAAAFAIAR